MSQGIKFFHIADKLVLKWEDFLKKDDTLFYGYVYFLITEAGINSKKKMGQDSIRSYFKYIKKEIDSDLCQKIYNVRSRIPSLPQFLYNIHYKYKFDPIKFAKDFKDLFNEYNITKLNIDDTNKEIINFISKFPIKSGYKIPIIYSTSVSPRYNKFSGYTYLSYGLDYELPSIYQIESGLSGKLDFLNSLVSLHKKGDISLKNISIIFASNKEVVLKAFLTKRITPAKNKSYKEVIPDNASKYIFYIEQEAVYFFGKKLTELNKSTKYFKLFEELYDIIGLNGGEVLLDEFKDKFYKKYKNRKEYVSKLSSQLIRDMIANDNNGLWRFLGKNTRKSNCHQHGEIITIKMKDDKEVIIFNNKI